MRRAANDDSYYSGCPAGCPEGECYCAEPNWAEMNDLCTGCGGMGECYCGEP